MNFFRAISNILRFDRTNWKALALCFFAAGIFWIFNALNKEYSTNLRIPLEVEFDNSKFIAVEPLPAGLLLNVSGNGWEIFRKSLGFKVPNISMPLERPAEVHKIVTSSLAPLVASQIGILQLNYIVTDTLRIHVEPKSSRKVKLLADLRRVSFRNNFGRVSPVVVLPDSVTLEGPKSIIEKLHDTVTLDVASSRVNRNFRENIEVIVPNKNLVSRNPPVAQVLFEVGPVEEIKMKARLEMTKGLGTVEIDNDSVLCIFRVPEKDRHTFLQEAKGLAATLDLKDLKKGESRWLIPLLKGNFSGYNELVHIDSLKVKKY